jgi:hypothetical protein
MARGASQVDFEAALQDPQAFFAEPQDVGDDPQLSREEKLAILRRWEQDALRLSASEAEGMGGGEENPASAAQAALRLAGERDHANEDADFGVPVNDVLHGEPAGLTPTDAPGAKTIRTADLLRLLAEARPVVIDTVANS